MSLGFEVDKGKNQSLGQNTLMEIAFLLTKKIYLFILFVLYLLLTTTGY